MNILLLYHNFVRDFRGNLLLADLLRAKGHKVWILAHWNQDILFAKVFKIDLIVTGQIAESSTYYIAEYAKENNIRLVINSTENIASPGKLDAFVRYNNNGHNENYIDLQSIAMPDIYNYVLTNPDIKEKSKYKLIGFPRFDISSHKLLRNVENEYFIKKYDLKKYDKVYIYISSILFEGAYVGISDEDKNAWKLDGFLQQHRYMFDETVKILKELIKNEIGSSNVLLIKKHPWDCDSYFNTIFDLPNCKVLDNTDYIVPCLNNSDFILHGYSSAAMEAWLMKKRTISILPETLLSQYKCNHMEHEVIVHNYEQLSEVIRNYPNPEPFVLTTLFDDKYDGLASVRLANEIDKLRPYPKKVVNEISIKTKIKVRLAYTLRDLGLLKFDVEKNSQPNTKFRDFLVWENQRSSIIKMYKKAIRQYIKENSI